MPLRVFHGLPSLWPSAGIRLVGLFLRGAAHRLLDRNLDLVAFVRRLRLRRRLGDRDGGRINLRLRRRRRRRTDPRGTTILLAELRSVLAGETRNSNRRSKISYPTPQTTFMIVDWGMMLRKCSRRVLRRFHRRRHNIWPLCTVFHAASPVSCLRRIVLARRVADRFAIRSGAHFTPHILAPFALSVAIILSLLASATAASLAMFSGLLLRAIASGARKGRLHRQSTDLLNAPGVRAACIATVSLGVFHVSLPKCS